MSLSHRRSAGAPAALQAAAGPAQAPLQPQRARRRLLLAGAAAALGSGALPGRAQDAAARRITLVVGYPAGGATDVAARVIADGLHAQLGATIVVDNRPGAGARIALDYVRQAKADGSVLLFTIASPLVIYPHIYAKLPYDALRDFTPVGLAGRSVTCLSVGPAVPDNVKTVADYVAWVKANPALATFGTVSGATTHFAGLLFARAAGIELRLVPYKGGAQAITDCIGGHLPATVTPVSEAQPYHAAGKLRTLATMGAQRVALLPNVPTLAELGYDVDVTSWMGVVGPAGMPPAVTAQLSAAMLRAVKTDEVASGIRKLGMEVDPVSPAQFASIIKSDHELFRKAVAATGFKAED